MKYLVLIIVVLVVFWFWRRAQRENPPSQSAAPPPKQQDMVQCPVCSVHLPRSDALPGPNGQLYCCAEHRLRAGG